MDLCCAEQQLLATVRKFEEEAEMNPTKEDPMTTQTKENSTEMPSVDAREEREENNTDRDNTPKDPTGVSRSADSSYAMCDMLEPFRCCTDAVGEMKRALGHEDIKESPKEDLRAELKRELELEHELKLHEEQNKAKDELTVPVEVEPAAYDAKDEDAPVSYVSLDDTATTQVLLAEELSDVGVEEQLYKSALTELVDKDNMEPRVAGPVSVDETDWPDVEEVPTDERLDLVNELADEGQSDKSSDKDDDSMRKVLANDVLCNIDDDITQEAPEEDSSSKSNLSIEEDAEEDLPSHSTPESKEDVELTQEQDETETEERERDCPAVTAEPNQHSKETDSLEAPRVEEEDKVVLVEATIKEGIKITEKEVDIIGDEELAEEPSKDEETLEMNAEEAIVHQEKEKSRDEKVLEMSNDEKQEEEAAPVEKTSNIEEYVLNVTDIKTSGAKVTESAEDDLVITSSVDIVKDSEAEIIDYEKSDDYEEDSDVAPKDDLAVAPCVDRVEDSEAVKVDNDESDDFEEDSDVAPKEDVAIAPSIDRVEDSKVAKVDDENSDDFADDVEEHSDIAEEHLEEMEPDEASFGTNNASMPSKGTEEEDNSLVDEEIENNTAEYADGSSDVSENDEEASRTKELDDYAAAESPEDYADPDAVVDLFPEDAEKDQEESCVKELEDHEKIESTEECAENDIAAMLPEVAEKNKDELNNEYSAEDCKDDGIDKEIEKDSELILDTAEESIPEQREIEDIPKDYEGDIVTSDEVGGNESQPKDNTDTEVETELLLHIKVDLDAEPQVVPADISDESKKEDYQQSITGKSEELTNDEQPEAHDQEELAVLVEEETLKSPRSLDWLDIDAAVIPAEDDKDYESDAAVEATSTKRSKSWFAVAANHGRKTSARFASAAEQGTKRSSKKIKKTSKQLSIAAEQGTRSSSKKIQKIVKIASKKTKKTTKKLFNRNKDAKFSRTADKMKLMEFDVESEAIDTDFVAKIHEPSELIDEMESIAESEEALEGITDMEDVDREVEESFKEHEKITDADSNAYIEEDSSSQLEKISEKVVLAEGAISTATNKKEEDEVHDGEDKTEKEDRYEIKEQDMVQADELPKIEQPICIKSETTECEFIPLSDRLKGLQNLGLNVESKIVLTDGVEQEEARDEE